MSSEKVSKEQLLSKLLEGVKGCQSRFGSRTELATEDDEAVRKLCIAFENVFLHGVKGQEKGRSLWQMTENFVPSGLRAPMEVVSFWPLVKSQLSKHDAERFLLLHTVRSDYGRARAWLRSALNEHSLERYILILLSLDNLQNYYESWAFLLDPELSAILPQTAAGLGSVLFALVVDNPYLDSWNQPLASKEEVVASPVEVAEVADLFLAATLKDKSDSPSSSTPTNASIRDEKILHLKKKKKKLHVNVVSFDDDDNENSPSVGQSKSKIKTVSSPTSSSTTTPTPTATPTLIPIDRKLSDASLKGRKLFHTSDDSQDQPRSTTPVQIISPKSRHEDSPSAPEISIYSSSVKSMDCISVNSVYSDCSERLDIDNIDLNFGRISPSQRLKPLRDRGAEGNGTDYNDPDSSSQDLIPVPNFDPITAPEMLSIDLDKNYIASPSPVATPSCASEPISNSHKNDPDISRTHSINSIPDANVVDARARISNLFASDSDDDRILKLKSILDREIETVAILQAQLAEEKRKSTDQIKIFEARVESLTKENEILKHQLHKYIGAVQLLKTERGSAKRTSSFDEDDDQLLNQALSEKVPKTSTSEDPDEGAEYERKLIQVAEMHGELMEFNAHLQQKMGKRELVIRRLREELVDLRGPLAAPHLAEDAFDDESWDIVDSSNSHDSRNLSVRHISFSHNERILINIWIPSAFLTGANTDLHHVYQVFIRIKDTEWNVYRRYSQFYSLHRDLKKRDSVIGSFYFPPKKHLGNKDGKFVDERRRKLQEYLRKVMNHTLQTNSILAAHPDKNLLISIFPFFGESSSVHNGQKQKRERSRSRNLFFLSSSQSHNQVQNSSSGLVQSQTHYPQYTGL